MTSKKSIGTLEKKKRAIFENA